MDPRTASSQVAWALLTEGVTRARLESHRLQHLINRASTLVDQSPEREHLYQVAGDVIVALPQRLEQLQVALDRTSLALAKMGEEFLSSRLSLADKNLVNEAVESAFGGGRRKDSQATRVARRWLAARGAPR